MAKNYSPEIAKAINTFLTEDDWKFEFDSERGMFHFKVGLKSGIKSANYIINVNRDRYTVYAYSSIGPDKGDQKTMQRTAEFLTRANYGLAFGNFELDMDDGEIRYKVCTACDDGPVSEETIRYSIYVPGTMLDRYGKGLLKVLYSDISPKDACEQCEEDDD